MDGAGVCCKGEAEKLSRASINGRVGGFHFPPVRQLPNQELSGRRLSRVSVIVCSSGSAHEEPSAARDPSSAMTTRRTRLRGADISLEE